MKRIQTTNTEEVEVGTDDTTVTKVTTNTTFETLEALGELGLAKKDITFRSSPGIPMEHGMRFYPQETKLTISRDELEKAQSAIHHSAKKSRFDFHPLAFLYCTDVMDSMASPRDYLDDPDWWLLRTHVEHQGQDKVLVFELETEATGHVEHITVTTE